jgi:DNA replication protein
MSSFNGFSHGQFAQLPLPPGFFTQLLPLIDDVNELKLTLFCLNALSHKPTHTTPFLRHRQLLCDEDLLACLPPDALEAALARCVARGTLLSLEVTLKDTPEQIYFVNTPRGRSAVHQIQRGIWCPTDAEEDETPPETPNLYALYEQNIGPLTAHIAQELKDAAAEFSEQWLKDAIRISVERNRRSWHYVRGILSRWKNEGRHHEIPAQPDLEDGSRFVGGKYADFVES